MRKRQKKINDKAQLEYQTNGGKKPRKVDVGSENRVLLGFPEKSDDFSEFMQVRSCHFSEETEGKLIREDYNSKYWPIGKKLYGSVINGGFAIMNKNQKKIRFIRT